MDLNGDGKVDILSGSYSRHDADMAGLFQVLWGSGKGEFKKATQLLGADGEPLIITATRKNVTDKICTRPTAVDLDGDGKLDIVSGNFAGSFAFFKGLGKGKFEPKHSWIMAGNQRLMVKTHSDPFFVDWDKDGDLDMLSGTGQGGVMLCTNKGSKTKPDFAQPVAVIEGVGYSGKTVFGDAHVKGPQRATRVFADDINGDGKLDLLVGDSLTLTYPAEGLDEATARKKLGDWSTALSEMRVTGKPTKAALKELNKARSAHYKKRSKIVKSDSTGFVWVYYGK